MPSVPSPMNVLRKTKLTPAHYLGYKTLSLSPFYKLHIFIDQTSQTRPYDNLFANQGISHLESAQHNAAWVFKPPIALTRA